MAAYMIVHAYIHDREKFVAGYAPAAAKIAAQYGGEYIVRAPGAETLEGKLDSGSAVVVSKWSNKQAILDFWNSPEYAAAKKLREGVCDCEITIVEEPGT